MDEASADEEHPVSPKKLIIGTLAILFSLLVPIMIIILKTYFSTIIHNREDLENITSIPIIGVIGHLTEGNNLVVLQKPKSAISESLQIHSN